VARVELCTHLAYRKGEDGNPPPVHRRARALSQQQNAGQLTLHAAARRWGPGRWLFYSPICVSPKRIVGRTSRTTIPFPRANSEPWNIGRSSRTAAFSDPDWL